MPDSDRRKLVAAQIRDKLISVAWDDGETADFHAVWLRHSPGFPGGARPSGTSGRFPSQTTEPVEASADGGERLCIAWSDGQRSEHQSDWLYDNRYDPGGCTLRRPVEPWSANECRPQATLDYDDLNGDETARLPLFERLLDDGAVLLRNLPAENHRLLEVADWLGHVPANLYADDPAEPRVGNVRIDPDMPVATSQCHFLGPHTDTCWRQTLSGLVLLHCLRAHPKGGRSIVVDGFAVAERLRAEQPEAFDLLARVPLEFGSKVADRDDWRVMGRVLSVAADGTLEGIRYNGNSIGQLKLPTDMIEPVYAALEHFDRILNDRDLWWQPQLAPGDLLILDNHRVLHGREAFDPGVGERHLQTCSVDRDDFHNRYRRLARELGLPGANQRLSAGVI